jgi:hypothetical protein
MQTGLAVPEESMYAEAADATYDMATMPQGLAMPEESMYDMATHQRDETNARRGSGEPVITYDTAATDPTYSMASVSASASNAMYFAVAQGPAAYPMAGGDDDSWSAQAMPSRGMSRRTADDLGSFNAVTLGGLQSGVDVYSIGQDLQENC